MVGRDFFGPRAFEKFFGMSSSYTGRRNSRRAGVLPLVPPRDCGLESPPGGGLMSVLQGLRRACQINPNGVATIAGDRRRTWTAFRDRVARFAGALRAAGVQPGDRVAILALNSDAYLECFYAAPWAGAL